MAERKPHGNRQWLLAWAEMHPDVIGDLLKDYSGDPQAAHRATLMTPEQLGDYAESIGLIVPDVAPTPRPRPVLVDHADSAIHAMMRKPTMEQRKAVLLPDPPASE